MDPTLIPSDGSAAERPEETGGGLALDPEAEPSAVRLDALLTADPKFRRSWGQDRKDQSPTAYNLSLATMAMGVGWSDQEVVNLLICWRRKHGHDRLITKKRSPSRSRSSVPNHRRTMTAALSRFGPSLRHSTGAAIIYSTSPRSAPCGMRDTRSNLGTSSSDMLGIIWKP